jgi:O-antigen/teichoic acid export membrane protein
MNHGRLATNAFAVTVQVVVTGVALFELYRFLNRHLTVEEIGIWSVVLASATTGRLIDLGLGGGVVKFVAEYLGTGARSRALMIIQMAFVGMAILTSVSCAVLYPVLFDLLPHLIRGPSALATARQLLPYAFVALILGALSGVLLSALDGCQRMDLRAQVGIGGAVVQLLAAYLLVPSHGLVGLAASQIIQAAVMMTFAAYLVCRELRCLVFRAVKWEAPAFGRLLRYGGGMQAAAVGQLMFEPVAKALVARFGGLELTGYYEMANRMIVQLRSVIVSAYQALVPYVAGSAKDARQICRVYLSSYRMLFFLSATYYAMVGIALPFVLQFWLGRSEPRFLLVADSCLLGWAINTLIAPAYYMFLGVGRLKWPVVAHLAIGFASASVGFLVGHLYGGIALLYTVALVLALGSHIVTYAFHREHGIGLAELLPRGSVGLAVGAFVGTIVVTCIANARGEGSLSLAAIAAALLAAGVLVSAWSNANRPVLTGLVRAALLQRST